MSLTSSFDILWHPLTSFDIGGTDVGGCKWIGVRWVIRCCYKRDKATELLFPWRRADVDPCRLIQKREAGDSRLNLRVRGVGLRVRAEYGVQVLRYSICCGSPQSSRLVVRSRILGRGQDFVWAYMDNTAGLTTRSSSPNVSFSLSARERASPLVSVPSLVPLSRVPFSERRHRRVWHGSTSASGPLSPPKGFNSFDGLFYSLKKIKQTEMN